jgi:hypothetical protein
MEIQGRNAEWPAGTNAFDRDGAIQAAAVIHLY